MDGDTFACKGGRRVRLLLIDTPELSQGAAGTVAAQALLALLPPGREVGLEFDVQRRDRYERSLAYVWIGDSILVNEVLLRRGVAVMLVYPPNVKYVERFRAAVAEARAEKVGLWVTEVFRCEPRDHRAGRC